jgi:hypothetical protein
MKPLGDMSKVLGLILAAGVAQGQVAPPPPAAPAPTPPYVAPPPPPAPTAKPAPSGPSPSQIASQEAIRERREVEAMEFESIAVKDEQGNIKPLPEPVEWYALKHNPLIKPIRLAMCEKALRERRAKYESLVIDNVDIMERFDSGLVQSLDMTDKSRISEIVQLVKPFQSMGTLTNELKKQKVIEGAQAAMNQRIASDYVKKRFEAERLKNGLPAEMKKEEGKEAAKDPAKAGGVNIQVRVMLETAMEEPTFFYHQLLLDAGARFADLGIGAEHASKFQAAKTDEEKIDIVKNVMVSMTLEQKRDFLKRALALRPPLPPLPDAEKMAKDNLEASGVEMITWRGPRELVDARIALHTKVKESKALAKELADAMTAAAKPDATPEAKAALDGFKPRLAEAKAAEDAARKVVLDLVEKHPDYKVFLDNEVSKRDGVYFPAPGKAKDDSAEKGDTKPAAEGDKK